MQEGEARSTDGLRIRYRHGGAGETMLVFVHGLSCNRSHWDHQLATFADRYQVVALDLGGHGASHGRREEWTAERFADDVVAVLGQLHPARAILIGHSMGGYVIPLVARRRPDIVIGLVGVDSWTGFDASQPPLAFAAFVEDFSAAMDLFVRSMLPVDTDPLLLARIAQDMGATAPEVVVGIMRALGGGGSGDVLKGLPIPKAAIGSDHFRPKSAAVAAEHGFSLTKMEGVGHFPMMERPEAFNRHLAAALSAIEQAGG